MTNKSVKNINEFFGKTNGELYDSWDNYHPIWKALAIMSNFNKVWGEENIDNVATIGWTNSYSVLKFGKIRYQTEKNAQQIERNLKDMSSSLDNIERATSLPILPKPLIPTFIIYKIVIK